MRFCLILYEIYVMMTLFIETVKDVQKWLQSLAEEVEIEL